MDAANTPPLRIQVARSEPISPSELSARLQNFMTNYEARRGIASNGADSAVSPQMLKLVSDIMEESEAGRKARL